MSKHTAGHWKYLQSGIAGEFVVKSDTHPDLSIGIASDIDTEANARLISAAPELLEALIQAVAWMDGEQTPINALVHARSIIAKARGEQV